MSSVLGNQAWIESGPLRHPASVGLPFKSGDCICSCLIIICLSGKLPLPTCHPHISWKGQNKLNFLPIPNFPPAAEEHPASISPRARVQTHAKSYITELSICGCRCTLSPLVTKVQEQPDCCMCWLLSSSLDIQWAWLGWLSVQMESDRKSQLKQWSTVTELERHDGCAETNFSSLNLAVN